MNKTTTRELISYAYNETDLKDSDRIQRSIDGDPLVQQEYSELVQILSQLDHGKVQPGAQSVEKILSFGKSLNA